MMITKTLDGDTLTIATEGLPDAVFVYSENERGEQL